MKKLSWMMFVIPLLVVGLMPASSLAQDNNPVNFSEDGDDYPMDEFLSEADQLPAGHVARYRVTYMKSNTSFSNRTATVISITNNSNITCSTSVDWKVGFGGVVATTTLSLGPGNTGEHCSRSFPSAFSSCNATASPALTATEGSAVIGSENVTTCNRIAVDARVYYTTGTDDSGLSGIADVKVVRIRGANKGD